MFFLNSFIFSVVKEFFHDVRKNRPAIVVIDDLADLVQDRVAKTELLIQIEKDSKLYLFFQAN